MVRNGEEMGPIIITQREYNTTTVYKDADDASAALDHKPHYALSIFLIFFMLTLIVYLLKQCFKG